MRELPSPFDGWELLDSASDEAPALPVPLLDSDGNELFDADGLQLLAT